MTLSYNQDEVKRLVCLKGWAVKIIVGHVSSVTALKISESFLILFSLRWLLFQLGEEKEQALHV